MKIMNDVDSSQRVGTPQESLLSPPHTALAHSPVNENGVYATPAVNWVSLVDKIKQNDQSAMDELYRVLSGGIKFYLCRQLGPQEMDDKVHDTFVIVVQAIQRGELREPERLMGFVRTIVRRQVAAHINQTVRRRNYDDVDVNGQGVKDSSRDPEQAAMDKQREALATKILKSISQRDRDVLTRFYLMEQSQEQICMDMGLTETQFRLLKSCAKARFTELGKRCLGHCNRLALKKPLLAIRAG
jgi:RNA polymerase sigma-70 factor, ECF subfamily